MKRLVFAFALLALLAVPAPAMAKELTKVEVCGADGCAAITGKTNLQNFGGSGEPDGSVAAPAPFYEIRYTIDAEGESSQWSSWYVPSAKRLADGRRAGPVSPGRPSMSRGSLHLRRV